MNVRWVENTQFILQHVSLTGVWKSLTEEQLRIGTSYAWKDMRTLDAASFEQIKMIAHLPELHHKVHQICRGLLSQLRVCRSGRF